MSKFDQLALSAIRTPLKLVHPRRCNRTETMWSSAITVTADTKLPAVFEVLISENILSAVVLSAEGKVVGFIDMADIMQYTVGLFGAAPNETELAEFFAKSKKFREVTVNDIMDLTQKPMWRPMTAERDFSLFYSLEAIARLGTHRLAVVHKEKVVGVVTESMIIGWCFVNLAKMGDARKTPVSELTRSYFVSSIEESELALKAFKQMSERKLSALAVVDKFGTLKDTISTRDLKGIGADAELFTRLWEPVSEFKKKVRKHTPHAQSIPKQPLYVLESDTLETVITTMEKEAVHRLWVVKSAENLRPINVITQSDVIRYILPY
jgi:CBS domain-containing protein